MFISNQCPICNQTFQKLSKHIASSHKDFKEKQEQLIISYYNQNMSAEKISKLPDIMYEAKSGVVRILNKHFSLEQMEEKRKFHIGKTSKENYASGEYDWIKEINTKRNQSEDGRAKNSKGLIKSYESGEKRSWNFGLTARTDTRIKRSSEKIKEVMKCKFERKELKTLFKSGPESRNWIVDRTLVSANWRISSLFQKNDRDSLMKRANYCCEECGISEELLKNEKEILQENRLTLECDHIIPIKDNGIRDWKNNGKVLCSRDHIIKTLKERSSVDKHEAIENRYNSEPVTYLFKKYGGTINVESNSWEKDNISVYISPLTKLFAGKKYTIKDIKDKNSNTLIFFSDEWYLNRDIAISMIENKLKQSVSKIHARKTKIVELTHKESKDFFEKNHISGDAKNIYSFGLIINGEIVSAISFRNSFIEKYKNKIEIARFASKLNTNVVGGFSKLLKHSISFLRERKYDSILTYADLRFGGGNVYSINGFSFVGKTKLDYHYTNGYKRENRFSYRAKPGIPEKDVASAAGVYKIHGCGSNIYELKL
jgi:hypothetical protein